MAVEGTDADIALSAPAETRAGCAHDSCLAQEHVKEIPGVHAGLHPDIGRVLPSRACVSKHMHTCPDKGGIVHVVADEFFYLGPAFIRIDRLSSLLHRVGDAV